jgi:hypothetical protein
MFNDAERQKLAAALEQLEIEKRAREDARIEAGGAVRVPLVAVVPAGVDHDKALEEMKAHKIAALRADGDTREVLFEEPFVIETGVPRPETPPDWQPPPMSDKDPAHSVHADRRAAAIEAETKPPPAPVAEPELEWKRVQTQVSPPDERSCGVIIEGSCAVRGSQLHVRDHSGREWTVPLAPSDNPEIRARKLLREKFGKHHAFNAPIHYPPRSYH